MRLFIKWNCITLLSYNIGVLRVMHVLRACVYVYIEEHNLLSSIAYWSTPQACFKRVLEDFLSETEFNLNPSQFRVGSVPTWRYSHFQSTVKWTPECVKHDPEICSLNERHVLKTRDLRLGILCACIYIYKPYRSHSYSVILWSMLSTAGTICMICVWYVC